MQSSPRTVLDQRATHELPLPQPGAVSLSGHALAVRADLGSRCDTQLDQAALGSLAELLRAGPVLDDLEDSFAPTDVGAHRAAGDLVAAPNVTRRRRLGLPPKCSSQDVKIAEREKGGSLPCSVSTDSPLVAGLAFRVVVKDTPTATSSSYSGFGE